MLARLRHAIRGLLQLNGTPHGVALGFTLGVGLSLIPLPFVGMTVALLIAPFVRASLPATYLGTTVVNPVSGALFYFGELFLGASLLGLETPSWQEARGFDARTWAALARELLPAFALGGLLMAALASALVYPGLRLAVARYQRTRH